MVDTVNATRTLTDDLSLTDALNFYITKILQNINTITLAEIKEINLTTKRATVQPLINGVDSNNNPIVAPLIYDVPYGTIRGGNAGIITEYQIGDNVILGFCQRQIDATKRTKKASTPSLVRYHNLADAVIICAWNETEPTIYVKATAAGIDIESGSQPITINTTGNVTINCNKATVTATEVDIDSSNINLGSGGNGILTKDAIITAPLGGGVCTISNFSTTVKATL